MSSFSPPQVAPTLHLISELDDSIDVTNDIINKADDVCVVLSVATSWSKQSKAIDPSLFSGSRLTDVIVLHTDEDADVEELAMDLGLTSVPACKIFVNGKVFRTLLADDSDSSASAAVSQQSIQSAITEVCSISASDWKSIEDQREMVSAAYGATAKTTTGGCCVSVDSTLMGYSAADLLKAGSSAVLGLGCGNPLSFAELQAGETVVDLGAGAGIDCFIAGSQVGAGGHVIGVDMTPEMMSKARKNAKDGNHNNVEFRLGEIEHLPIADSTVDCVISNCVINLSPDKQQVVNEIFRVLKSGGRVAVADVVARPGVDLPPHLRTAEALAC
jgi:arsenite methyltransferase